MSVDVFGRNIVLANAIGAHVSYGAAVTKISEVIGQQMVVDNRAGADGRIGSELIARAPADGYTLGIGTIGTLVVAPLVYANTGYDPAVAFAPVTRMTTAPYLIVVHPGVGASNLKELIDLAKAKPGSLNYATANAFARLHNALLMIDSMPGNTNRVPATRPPLVRCISQPI